MEPNMCLISNVISWVNLISVNKMKLAVADEEICSFAIFIFDLYNLFAHTITTHEYNM